MSFINRKNLIIVAGTLVILLVLVAVLSGGSDSSPVSSETGGQDDTDVSDEPPGEPPLVDAGGTEAVAPADGSPPASPDATPDLADDNTASQATPGDLPESNSPAPNGSSQDSEGLAIQLTRTVKDLAAYTAVSSAPGYAEDPDSSAQSPPSTTAVRFRLEPWPGHFWLSLFDGGNVHYNQSPDLATAREHYSSLVLGQSCYAIVSDLSELIVKYVTSVLPADEAALDDSLHPIRSLHVVLEEAGIDNLVVYDPTFGAEPKCVDAV